MAVVTTVSNHFKYMNATKKVDMANDVFKIILMNTAFVFDKDAHATLADVTASQLSTGNGYTQNDAVLDNVVVTEDDDNDKCSAVWDDEVFTASEGDIGPAGAAIIYDDSTTDDTVVMCIDLGEDVTISNGSNYTIKNIEVDFT